MGGIADALRLDLRQSEFSEGYAESFLDTYVATQIRVLREQREMTQAQLAEKLGTKQTVISRIESANYSAWNIGTLKRLARAFNVRLHVSFETYGSLIGDFEKFSRESLERAERDKDPVLYPLPAVASEPKESVAFALEGNFQEFVRRAIKQQEQQGGRVLYVVPPRRDLEVPEVEQPRLSLMADISRQSQKSQVGGDVTIALTGVAATGMVGMLSVANNLQHKAGASDQRESYRIGA